MRNIIIMVIVAMAVLQFAGCIGGTQYDSRLVAVDSLLTSDPDSALSCLACIDESSLTNDGNRAYHALLLTQAQYRCYITASSDSAINLAVSYYERHSNEREKLTRAYIYKGAITDELGDYKAAIGYYKRAALTVPAEDQFLQGYIKLRMGNIYRDHQVADSSDVVLFKQALDHFKQVPDSFYILTCLSEIGSSYYKTNPDSVMRYLTEAHELAQRLHEDDILVINDINIDEYKIFKGSPKGINEAKNHALSLIHSNISTDNMVDVLMIAAYTLAKQGKVGSASIYLNRAHDMLNSPNDTVFYYKCQAELARCRGDMGQYQHYMELKTQINDSLSTNSMQYMLREVEERYDNETLKNEKLRYRNMLTVNVLSSLLILSLLAISLLAIMHKGAQRKRQLRESEDRIAQLNAEADELSTHLKANKEMSDALKQAINHQLSVFSQLVEMHRSQLANNPSKFSKLFEECYQGNKPDLSFWKSLQSYADSTHSGLITHLKETNEDLTESDLHMLCLCCCHLPTTVIMACMGYNDAHSVYNKKRRVALTLGLDGRLEPFIRAHEKSAEEGEDSECEEKRENEGG